MGVERMVDLRGLGDSADGAIELYYEGLECGA